MGELIPKRAGTKPVHRLHRPSFPSLSLIRTRINMTLVCRFAFDYLFRIRLFFGSPLDDYSTVDTGDTGKSSILTFNKRDRAMAS